MTDLVEFLQARLDEDEQAAQAAEGERWRVGLFGQDIDQSAALILAEDESVLVDNRVESDAVRLLTEDLVHIARHDPGRVQREVKAGRALLRRHRAAKTNAESQPDSEFLRGRLSGYEEALKIAALAYADHPEFREEWKL